MKRKIMTLTVFMMVIVVTVQVAMADTSWSIFGSPVTEREFMDWLSMAPEEIDGSMLMPKTERDDFNLRETSFTPVQWIDMRGFQNLVQITMGGNLGFYSPGYLMLSKPAVSVEALVFEKESSVSQLSMKMTLEVGTTLAFSYNRASDGTFLPSVDIDFSNSYWGDLLDYEMVLILDDSKMSSSVSATRIKYGYEVTLTEDMIGRRLGLGIYGESRVLYGGASESMLEIEVVPVGTEQVLNQPSPWAAEQVEAAIADNLVPPILQSNYSQATTRAEFCALAVALIETVTDKPIPGRKTFSDTHDENVEKAAALGVVSGMGGDRFDPGAKLTREQAATMLARIADALGTPLAKQAVAFADNSVVSDWAMDGVGQVQAAGIMQGVGENMFAPQDSYTHEQSIITVKRLYDAIRNGAIATDEAVKPVEMDSGSASSEERYARLQETVNNGHQPWRLDPAEVVMEYAGRTLSYEGTAKTDLVDGERSIVIYTKDSGEEIRFDLYQPATKGDGGIWEVDSYFDENGEYRQVRDLTALPTLFYNDGIVPQNIRDAVKDVVINDWTDALDDYFDVLGFYAEFVTYATDEDTAEMKFVLIVAMRGKNAGSGDSIPQKLMLDMKVTVELDEAGEVVADSVLQYYNASFPDEGEYILGSAAESAIRQ